MKGRRQERAAAQVRAAIADILLREVKDPRLGLLTVTRVDMSADLKHARVFISAPGTEAERKRALAGLEGARGFLRSQLGGQIAMRYTPELKFVLDHSIDSAQRLEQILKEAAVEPTVGRGLLNSVTGDPNHEE